jgi:hypothetical protein
MGNNRGSLSPVEAHNGETIGQWLNSIDVKEIQARPDTDYMTNQDWQNIIEAAKNDDTIMNMRIAGFNEDKGEGGGNGRSALFISEDTGDAIVTFAGTGSGEWKDNFAGGNMTDTPCQQNALEWYQKIYQEQHLDGYEVTVTGHSKGGNKSKYITIMDGTVDHCVSFDGQGFSDKFMDAYADKIAARQGKIENHNIDHDYVNFLLNDIGKTTYYVGQDYGKGGFLENHCANTFMKFDENGNFVMVVNPDGRAPMIDALDGFVNGYLRSLPDDARTRALELIGSLAQGALSSSDEYKLSTEELIHMCLNDDSGDLAYLLAYAFRYAESYGFDQVGEILNELGLGSFNEIIGYLDVIINYKSSFGPITVTFEDIWKYLKTGGGALAALLEFMNLDELLYDMFKDKIPFGLSLEDLKKLIVLLGTAVDDVYKVEVVKDNADKKVRTGSSSISIWNHMQFHIAIDEKSVRNVETELDRISSELRVRLEEVRDIKKRLLSDMPVSYLFNMSLTGTCLQMETLATKTDTMSGCLETLLEKFEVIEEKTNAYLCEVV